MVSNGDTRTRYYVHRINLFFLLSLAMSGDLIPKKSKSKDKVAIEPSETIEKDDGKSGSYTHMYLADNHQ